MKIIRVVVILSLVSAALASTSFVDVWRVKANEYFGDGKMYVVQTDDDLVGLIFAWGSYVIYGDLDDCRIVPLWSPVSDAQVVECGMRQNKTKSRFRGWYDFRGHPRPFCGALMGKELPDSCFGE